MTIAKPITCPQIVEGRDGMVEAEICEGRELVGYVTLRKNAQGDLDTWGDSIDLWADRGVEGLIYEQADRNEAIATVVEAVRNEHRRSGEHSRYHR